LPVRADRASKELGRVAAAALRSIATIPGTDADERASISCRLAALVWLVRSAALRVGASDDFPMRPR